MRITLSLLVGAITSLANAQTVLKAGDIFPSIIIRNIINAPIKQLDVQTQNNKFLILNFWGTWCSPCLPEMDTLSKLQQHNNSKIQVIGISDEAVSRLENYLKRKPSYVWLASDTTMNLYRQFAFNYVGQSAIINTQNRIVTLVRTDSINQSFIDRLIQNQSIPSSAETGNKQETDTNLFGVDSTLAFQVSWSTYRAGVPSMLKTYLKSNFEGRRRTYTNLCLTSIIRDAYNISPQQMIYEIPEKEVCNWDDKNTLYCFDIVVRPEQKDSMRLILQHTLNQLFPVKARLEKRVIPVYILKRLTGASDWATSKNKENTFSFSGRGFEGKAISITPFADYVANELELPLIDKTGLTGKYDINTTNVLRTREDMLTALKKLGLTVEQDSREMDVVVIYK